MSELIEIKALNAELAGKTICNGAGQFTLDETGTTHVDVRIASEAFKNPHFEIPAKADRDTVEEFLSKSIVRDDGPYSPGEAVRVQCDELRGVHITASDGCKVLFTPDGYAITGKNTASALQQVVRSLVILGAVSDEGEAEADDKPKATRKPAAKADEAKADQDDKPKTTRKPAAKKSDEAKDVDKG